MRLYLDPSALSKRYIEETGTPRVLELCRKAREILLSAVALPEVISGLNHLRRGREITAEQYATIKLEVCFDCEEATISDITPEIVRTAIRCLELEPLRAADALHLATAKELACDLFVTADRAQRKAAERLGFKAEFV